MREELQMLYKAYLNDLANWQLLDQGMDSRDGKLEQFMWWILTDKIIR